MAVKTLDNLIERLKTFGLDDMSDSYISFMEDLSDTISQTGTASEELEKLRQEVETVRKEKDALDNDWRKRYLDRFYGGDSVKDFGREEAVDLEKPEEVVIKSKEEVAEEWQ